jgi:hypothetical protein
MATSSSSGKARLESILKDAQKEPSIDWEAKKIEWCNQIITLYDMIGTWLSGISSVLLTRQEIEITEEYIGKYPVQRLIIQFGNALVTLNPRGTIIIAARGRIDIQGPKGNAAIILTKKGERPAIIFSESKTDPLPSKESSAVDYEWLIVGKNKMKDLVVLNEDTFTNLIADLIQ